MDVWIEASPRMPPDRESARTGFGSLGLKEGDFLVPQQVIQLGHPPNRVDILNHIAGVEFAQCYTSRVAVDLDGLTVDFIDLDNLKKNKRATGRTQDLADLENLL